MSVQQQQIEAHHQSVAVAKALVDAAKSAALAKGVLISKEVQPRGPREAGAGWPGRRLGPSAGGWSEGRIVD
ncbi:MAG: hypothetical protein EOP82_08850 [Variovorax sp.]|nr:MAG: hypothetical protein EOP82_08850 [Variovorax sp.]